VPLTIVKTDRMTLKPAIRGDGKARSAVNPAGEKNDGLGFGWD